MTTVFLLCAIIGGTVLIAQFVLTLIGLGHADLDVDVPHDFNVEFDGADLGHVGEIGGAADVQDVGDAHYSSTRLFGVMSFRAIVAAITFFGIFGMTALSAGMSPPAQILIAVVGGGVAMYVVGWLMTMLKRLGNDGTLRIQHAIGKIGTVYVPIPGGKTEAGKVQLKVQERLVEYAAMTSHGATLPTGARVEVVGLIGPSTLDVRPVDESAGASDHSAESATA